MSGLRSTLLVIAGLLLLGSLYLSPGPKALLEGRVDVVMSDGSDPMTLPYFYDRLVQIWQEKPSDLMYGAVYDRAGDGDRGVAYWVPWSERWLVIFYSYFFPVEQLSTALIWTLLIANGLAMYLLARFLGWNGLLAFGLAVAWAFNCYTRARAKVHGGLTGTFHLPLIFLGLLLVARGRSFRSAGAAAAVFLVAASAAHYYLVTTVFLAPVFLVFFFIQPEVRKEWRVKITRLFLAALPAILFLGFHRFTPVPSDARMTADQSMNNEWLQSDEISPYLKVFHASPIDYLAGDISLGEQALDWNPIRGWIGDRILANLGSSNAHERTNGIRWTILLAFLVGLFVVLRDRGKKNREARWMAGFFFAFALFMFWMSLGPEAPIPALSPAYWLYSFDHHVRVSSRAAIGVHFAMLMVTGVYLSRARWFGGKWIPAVFVLLMIVDYFPLQKMPMAIVRPAFAQLDRSLGSCGPGMFFPYINQWNTPTEHYAHIQRMRGSDCSILNSMNDPQKVRLLGNSFPPSERYLGDLTNNPAHAERLVRFANCLPLNWIVFHAAVPRGWAIEVCGRLGWNLTADGTCAAQVKNKPIANSMERCL